MSEFVQGQRWVVDSEPELGLGIVVDVQGRSVSIFFPLGDCERRYAIEQAPLTRIVYHVDDTLKGPDGDEHKVIEVHEQNGIKVYDIGQDNFLIETQVSPEIQLNQPFMRLMMGQIDRRRWFGFRRTLDAAMAKVWASRLNGLLGVRAALVPHQLYVAQNACEREQVRVLLSDEVGLGKTLEAAMILNRLLKLERVSRAIILTPASLQVQWLVELIRRFNITPVIYDSEGHDFNFGQVHLVPHHVLATERENITCAEFDLAIVDEAHHVQHHSDEYEALQALAEQCPHLVLMTATPEQLGFDSHFARLQLLDSAKYSDQQHLKDEEQRYAELNTLIRGLPATRDQLINHYQLDAGLNEEEMINHLLDCHGVGRVMFRNARSTVAGFPKRVAHTHAVASDDWTSRFEWLAQFLKKSALDKVLVITHHRDQVGDCEQHLWQKHGIDAAVFHEDMNLIERDRAAAYFADMEQGARVLLCSEIGSEGRNFQFSHHLVCLDLPEHPDLLEQRIGRLDRIGQAQDVNIHVPIAPGGENDRRWQWFHETLDCVVQQNPAAGAVHDELFPHTFSDIDAALKDSAKQKVHLLAEEIRQGRDALLEMNSCREPFATVLADRIREFEADSPLPLVEQAADLLNFHFEELGQGRYSLIPADNMMIQSLPGIPPEGVELTFDRETANAREDLLFMTWDSPFITGLWELLHHSELGCASVAMLPSRQLPPGKCLLEACFDVVVQSECATQCLPFLPQFSVRSLTIDISDNDLSSAISEEQLQNSLEKVDKKLARQIIKSQKDALPDWYAKAEKFAEKQKLILVDNALAEVNQFFAVEKERLTQLAKKNANIDDADVDSFEAKQNAITSALTDRCVLKLSALRLIVTNKP